MSTTAEAIKRMHSNFEPESRRSRDLTSVPDVENLLPRPGVMHGAILDSVAGSGGGKSKLSRRNFLQLSLLASGSAALAACAPGGTPAALTPEGTAKPPVDALKTPTAVVGAVPENYKDMDEVGFLTMAQLDGMSDRKFATIQKNNMSLLVKEMNWGGTVESHNPTVVMLQNKENPNQAEFWYTATEGDKLYLMAAWGKDSLNKDGVLKYVKSVIKGDDKSLVVSLPDGDRTILKQSADRKLTLLPLNSGTWVVDHAGTIDEIKVKMGGPKVANIPPVSTKVPVETPVSSIPKDVDEGVWKAAMAESLNSKEIKVLTENGQKPVWNAERKLIEIGDAHKDGFAWNSELKFWGKLVPISKYDSETKTYIQSGSYFVARYLINPAGRVAERAALQLSSQDYDGVVKMSGVSRIETVVALGKDIQYNLVGMVIETGEIDLTDYLISNIQNLSETEAGIFYKGKNQIFKTAKIQVADSMGNLTLITALICPKDRCELSTLGHPGSTEISTWADHLQTLKPGNLLEIIFAIPQRPSVQDNNVSVAKTKELYIHFGVNSGFASVAKRLGVPSTKDEVVFGLNKELNGIAVTHDVNKLALNNLFMTSYNLINVPSFAE